MFFQRVDRAMANAEAAAQPAVAAYRDRVAEAGKTFGERARRSKTGQTLSWANISKPLNKWFLCIPTTERAAKVVVIVFFVVSLVSAIRPLAEPISWVSGGFGDACIGISILGSLGLFFSVLGFAGFGSVQTFDGRGWVTTPHPGYVHAFQRFLEARLLMSIPIFVADRMQLHRCEAYVNNLMHRIDPSLILRRIALDGRCEQARNFATGRWIFEFFFTLYCIRVIYYAHEDLAEKIPYNDVFEDPAEFLLNRRWRFEKGTAGDKWIPGSKSYGTNEPKKSPNEERIEKLASMPREDLSAMLLAQQQQA
jgi:hypothetical protein